jgi:hypothetical protein
MVSLLTYDGEGDIRDVQAGWTFAARLNTSDGIVPSRLVSLTLYFNEPVPWNPPEVKTADILGGDLLAQLVFLGGISAVALVFGLAGYQILTRLRE